MPKQTIKESQTNLIDVENPNEQKEKDAELYLRKFIWIVGAITAFILFICMMVEYNPHNKDWLPFLICLIADVILMYVSLSILSIASGIARNLREINKKLK